MAALTLVTLVLRGCPALCGGASVNLRRGTSGAAYPTPEIDISMRHPTQDPVQVLSPEPWQEKPEVGNDLGCRAEVRLGLFRVDASSRSIQTAAFRHTLSLF